MSLQERRRALTAEMDMDPSQYRAKHVMVNMIIYDYDVICYYEQKLLMVNMSKTCDCKYEQNM